MSEPMYFLAASVREGNRLRHFHKGSPESVIDLLERPEKFRWAGFDMSTDDVAKAVATDCYEVRNGDRKILRLYQDGSLIFRGAANSDFLGWGQEHDQFLQWPRLNPVAIVECTTSFVYMYRNFVQHLVSVPDEALLQVELRNAEVNGHRLFLTKYYDRGIQNVSHPHEYPAHSKNADERLTASASVLIEHPARTAYQLLTRVYDMFDMETSLIPFCRGVGETAEIDVEAIKRL